MKTLSIIIPHHNSPDTLIRLLDSIPNNDWIETIIVDDRSQPDVIDEIDESLDKYPNTSFFRLPEGKCWAGTARNLGIDKSQGKWLLFADADDFYLSEFETILEPFLQSQADVVYFPPISSKADGEKGTRHERYERLLNLFCEKKQNSILYPFYVPWSKLVSREHVIKNGIRFDEVRASNDVMFSLKVAFYAESIECSRDSIYCVTESSHSLTKQLSKEVLDSRFVAACRYNDFLLQHKSSAPLLPMSLHIWNARHYGKSNMYQKFIESRRKGYPIFYGWRHFMRAFMKLFKR